MKLVFQKKEVSKNWGEIKISYWENSNSIHIEAVSNNLLLTLLFKN